MDLIRNGSENKVEITLLLLLYITACYPQLLEAVEGLRGTKGNGKKLVPFRKEKTEL